MQSSVAVTVSSPAMRNKKQMSRISVRCQLLAVDLDRRGTDSRGRRAVRLRVRRAPRRSTRRSSPRSPAGRPCISSLPYGVPGDLVGPDDAVLHLDEARQLVERETEQRQEDLRRERHRELSGEVDSVAIDESVDEVVRRARATGSSSNAISRGAKIGSRILRYFLWSGGSICNGISGRTFFRSTASMFDENVSGSRKISSISAPRAPRRHRRPASPASSRAAS